MEPFTLLLISAALSIGSQVMQYQAQQKAADKQAAAIAAASQNQLGYQEKINKIVEQEAERYNPAERMAAQGDIERDMTSQYDAALAKAQDVGYGSVNPLMQGALSSTYLKDASARTLKEGADAAELARLMAKIGSGTRLRQNEALRMNDTAQQIGLQANFARGQAGADELTAKVAAMADPKAQLLAGILGGFGTAGMTYGLSSALGPAKTAATTTAGAGFGAGSMFG